MAKLGSKLGGKYYDLAKYGSKYVGKVTDTVKVTAKAGYSKTINTLKNVAKTGYNKMNKLGSWVNGGVKKLGNSLNVAKNKLDDLIAKSKVVLADETGAVSPELLIPSPILDKLDKTDEVVESVAKGKLGNAVEGMDNPVNVKTPDLKTGVGYDAGDVPVRIDGEWSVNDMKQGLLGHPPRGLDSPDIHHGGQMPDGALHEVVPSTHRNNPALHPNKYNQGVTPEMRASDLQLHWWYRAREQGVDQILPDWIYDK